MVEPSNDRPFGLATLAIHGGGADADVDVLEQRLATLENGTAAVLFAAGSGLLVTALQLLLRPGEQIILADELTADWHRVMAGASGASGWAAVTAPMDNPAAFQRAVGPTTQAIVVPSIAPSGAVADIAALAAIARRAEVPLIVDNTDATPALCRPLQLGADIAIHRHARALAGASSPIGFVVDGGRFDWLASPRYPAFAEKRAEFGGLAVADAVGNFAFAAACRALRGPADGAVDVARLMSGLETLPLRMARHSDTARAIAEHLSGHRRVASASYAGLPGDRHHRLAESVCPAGAGTVVGLTLAGGAAAADALRAELRLIAVGLPDRPAQSGLVALGEGRLRLHVGLEDANDLIADLDRALAAV